MTLWGLSDNHASWFWETSPQYSLRYYDPPASLVRGVALNHINYLA
jgi:hypothetical protein